LLAKTLFDSRVALLSSSIYWLLPLELTQSAIVQTEPLVTLFTCLAFLAVARFSLHERKSWLIVAGVFGGFGFYVRPSALVVPVAVLAFIVLFHGRRIREAAGDVSLFLAGYGAAVLCVLGYYSRFVSAGELFARSPCGVLVWAADRIAFAFGVSVGPMDSFSSKASAVSWGPYYADLHQAVKFHAFLALGLGCAAIEFGYGVVRRSLPRRNILSGSLLYLWVFFLFIAYVFYFHSRGFFIGYSREFLAPLAVVFSVWVMRSIPALGRDGVLERVILGGLFVSGGWFFIQGRYAEFFGIGHHASLALALITLFSFAGAFESFTRRLVFVLVFVGMAGVIVMSRQMPLKAYLSGTAPSLLMIGAIYVLAWAFMRGKVPLPFRSFGRFVACSLVLSSMVVSISFAATVLDLAYGSMWSPRSVEMIVSELRAQTGEADEVMSGGVIWEVQASRRPFQMISHPMEFLHGISEEQKAVIERAVVARPPRAIILDGYTETTFMRVPLLVELLKSRYQFVGAAGPATVSVRMYRLIEEPVSGVKGLGKAGRHADRKSEGSVALGIGKIL
jgi:hypothetical protein